MLRVSNVQNIATKDLREVESFLKNCKIKTSHLKQTKKLKKFGTSSSSARSSFKCSHAWRCCHIVTIVSDLIGPPSNSPESGFEGMSTVQQYFSEKSVTDPVKYKVLQYPTLPTVDVGSRTKPILIPLELCVVIPGQLRSKSITGEISAKIIEHAAMLPQERYRNITTGSTFFDALASDQDAAHFGLNCLTPASVPMRVLGRVLPPPKLMYGKNRVIEPALKGTWNLAGGVTFARPAPTVG